jgi:RimJ/RimL family protein N-acetyltransferase
VLRPATPDDARLLHAWANDPVTRAQSFATARITWDEHALWFGSLLADPARVLWFLVVDGIEVASVRFDDAGPAPVVSVQVDPGRRGEGFGRRIVAEATPLYVSVVRRPVVAEIRPANRVSARVFEACGYVLVDAGDPLRYVSPPPVTTT